jgi:hypothetical protein
MATKGNVVSWQLVSPKQETINSFPRFPNSLGHKGAFDLDHRGRDDKRLKFETLPKTFPHRAPKYM